MAGRTIHKPQNLSMGLPPFELFQGTVQEQLQQAITWRRQQLAKSQSASSSSSLDGSPVIEPPSDTKPTHQLPLQPRCRIAATGPPLLSASQPTGPHHRPSQLTVAELSTSCRTPIGFSHIDLTTTSRTVKVEPTDRPLLTRGNQRGDSDSDDRGSRSSVTHDCRTIHGTATIAHGTDPRRTSTLQNMTESVKVKEDSELQHEPRTFSTTVLTKA